jgi:hypothetical protein
MSIAIMLSLHNIQTQFLKNIYPSWQGEGNLKIYHNNFFVTLTNVLRSLYPTIEKIVGEDFFKATARCFIQQHPSTTNSLNDYGYYFADFLRTFPQAAALPYLVEVAQLEWGCHEILNAAEISSNLNCLTTVPAEQYSQLKFQLTPASRLFDFQYPVYHIWQLCRQENNNDTVDLAEGGIKLLIARQQFAIKFYVLSGGEFALLNALAANKTIDEACMEALQVEDHIDIDNALKKYMAHGIIINCLL